VSIVAYLLGSISFALLLTRAKGIDLRSIGSGNLGATNAGRALGKSGAVAVYLLDAFKGFILPYLCLHWEKFSANEQLEFTEEWIWFAASVAGAAAWAGHVWPIWHKFKGGKGVATLSGAFLAINPIAILLAALVLFVVAKKSKVMAFGSIALGVALPIWVWVLDREIWHGPRQPVMVFALGAAVLTFWTHRSNLHRILKGEENHLGDKK